MNKGKQRSPAQEEFLLNEIECSRNSGTSSHLLFNVILISLMSIFMIAGVFLSRVEITEHSQLSLLRELKTSFMMAEKKKPAPVKKKRETPQKKVEQPVKNPSLEKSLEAEDKMAVKKVVKRKVYGVRRIFSKGLGSGYGGRDAVVAKLGNSLDVAPDTIKATQDDLKGELVSVTKISAMPKILISAKPHYTKEMKQNRITGKVRAKVLVDVDGYAKKIIIIRHLGYGTKLASINAIKKMKFKPGIKGNEPIAVWIPLTFRFELQV